MFLILLVGLALIGAAVVLVVRAAAIARARSVHTLSQIGSYSFASASADAAGRSLGGTVDGIAARLGELAEKAFGRLDEKRIRTLLISAGIYGISPRKFTGYRVLSVVALPLLWTWMFSAGGMAAFLFVLGLGGMIYAGWRLPVWIVQMRARRRLAQIEYDLPELIDLLVVTVEAGVGFNASLSLAADRLSGPLGEEIRLVLHEQTLGLATNEALRNLLERCDTPSVRSFVRSILQGETLGVSIGQIMRNLADEMRKRRRAAAEERAQKAPVKMLFPLAFLMLPSLFVVILWPAFHSILHTFGGR